LLSEIFNRKGAGPTRKVSKVINNTPKFQSKLDRLNQHKTKRSTRKRSIETSAGKAKRSPLPHIAIDNKKIP
jgi:hypothetical protein